MTKIVEVEVMVKAPEGPKDTIVFSDLNWTSAQVQNRIAQYIVEHGYGYPTDVVFGGTLPLFQGLRGGDTHVTMESGCPTSPTHGKRPCPTAKWYPSEPVWARTGKAPS